MWARSPPPVAVLIPMYVTCAFWGNTHTCPSVWEGYYCHRYIWVLGAQNWGVIWKKFYILIKINHWYSLKWQLIVERCSREACNPTRGWGRKITDLRPAKDKEKIESFLFWFTFSFWAFHSSLICPFSVQSYQAFDVFKLSVSQLPLLSQDTWSGIILKQLAPQTQGKKKDSSSKSCSFSR